MSGNFKLGVVLLAAISLIATGASLGWEKPDSSTSYLTDDSSYQLNASGNSTTSSVEFWYSKNDNSYQSIGTGSETNDYFTYNSLDLGGTFSNGDDVTFKVNNTNDSATVDVEIDQLSPDSSDYSITSPSSGYASSEDPTIEVEVTDSPSGVKNITMNVEDSNGNDEGSNSCSSNTCSIDLSDLDDESHDVEVMAYDNVGYSNNETLSFTVDSSYDGDDDPDIDIDGAGDGEFIDFDSDRDMNVQLDDADSESETTVRCYVEDVEVGSFTVSSGSSDVEDQCDVDHDEDEDYYDTNADVYVEMEDEAGNMEESDTIQIGLDADAPTVSELDSSSGTSTFNSNFNATFEAEDDVTSVADAEYFFDDSDVDEGDGNNVSDQVSDFSDGEFAVDLEGNNLDSGEHTLYFRVKDQVGKWSLYDTFDFEYYPGQKPEVSLDVPENVTVTAGESDAVSIDVENTGDFFISSMDIKVDSDVMNGSQTVDDFQPGDSVTRSFDLAPSEDEIGDYTVDVKVDRTSDSDSFTYRIRANQEQQDSIESDLQEYESKLSDLEQNVSELKQKVSGQKREILESNLSEFRSSVEEARSSVDEDEYYSAESALEGIDSEFEKARDSYDQVRQSYRSSRLWMMVFAGAGGIVVLGGGIFGLLVYTDRVDPSEIEEKIDEIGVAGRDLGSVEHRIKNLLGREAEAEEFEWDGFKER